MSDRLCPLPTSRAAGLAACLIFLGLVAALLAPSPAEAQGCIVPVRQGSPVVGTQGSPYLEEGGWRLGLNYRYFKSHRHFTGDHEDREREREGSEAINRIHLFDFNLTHAFTKRFTASIDVPAIAAERSTPVRDASSDVVDRDTQHAAGIGDIVVTGAMWLFDPEEFLKGNLGLSLGVKLPTGDSDVRHQATVRQGNDFVREERTVDQSITPGDGGFGIVLGLQAFYTVFERFTLFTQGLYLLNPRNTNGTPTFLTLEGEEDMSVPDAYLGRAGVTTPIPWLDQYGFAFTVAGRIEGVPVRDLIGSSDGFRRPGYAVSVEPGISWSWRTHNVGVSAPIAVYRNRLQSRADRHANPDRHGDAAFADWAIIVNYVHDFGGPYSRHEGEAHDMPGASGSAPESVSGAAPSMP